MPSTVGQSPLHETHPQLIENEYGARTQEGRGHPLLATRTGQGRVLLVTWIASH
jgi:hypothetical protein